MYLLRDLFLFYVYDICSQSLERKVAFQKKMEDREESDG